MKSASLTKVKSHLNSYLKTCGREPLLVTKNGRPIAAVVAVVDPDEIERLQLASSATLDSIFDKALQRVRQGDGLSHADVWSEVESWPNTPTLKTSATIRPRTAKKTARSR